jgi:hypothetical protein
LDRRNDKMGQNGEKRVLGSMEMVVWGIVTRRNEHNKVFRVIGASKNDSLLANLELRTETTEHFI